MTVYEVDILRRAHALFAAVGDPRSAEVAATGSPPPPGGTGMTAAAYRHEGAVRRLELMTSRGTDAELSQIIAEANRDHREAQHNTAAVLAAARADVETVPTNPMAARELMRRKVIRLRTQRLHVLVARRRARRHRAALRALRYRRGGGRTPSNDRRAETAVRAALSRLGYPYVWGAEGPDRFDCSGLVQWAYERAGIRLHRTTYDQINDGIPISPAQVRPGDLVFPHAGHVQLAIGDNLVVEAPYPGATVQISRMGTNVAIRRPV
ncbi:MAG: C40 family peptidase [Mycobacteriaceae bacterium]